MRWRALRVELLLNCRHLDLDLLILSGLMLVDRRDLLPFVFGVDERATKNTLC
jgi:hypothetical protein